jgi:hypothetical protein
LIMGKISKPDCCRDSELAQPWPDVSTSTTRVEWILYAGRP